MWTNKEMIKINQIIEALKEKASEHANEGQNYDADGWSIKASNEYAMRDAYYEAIEIIEKIAETTQYKEDPTHDMKKAAMQQILLRKVMREGE